MPFNLETIKKGQEYMKFKKVLKSYWEPKEKTQDLEAALKIGNS
jgi:hypothetical protein